MSPASGALLVLEPLGVEVLREFVDVRGHGASSGSGYSSRIFITAPSISRTRARPRRARAATGSAACASRIVVTPTRVPSASATRDLLDDAVLEEAREVAHAELRAPALDEALDEDRVPLEREVLRAEVGGHALEDLRGDAAHRVLREPLEEERAADAAEELLPVAHLQQFVEERRPCRRSAPAGPRSRPRSRAARRSRSRSRGCS